jgi:hypothetical protein
VRFRRRGGPRGRGGGHRRRRIAAVMPRAELPAIIPLRQFGEDTWLAPGVIKPVGDARASFALNAKP